MKWLLSEQKVSVWWLIVCTLACLVLGWNGHNLLGSDEVITTTVLADQELIDESFKKGFLRGQIEFAKGNSLIEWYDDGTPGGAYRKRTPDISEGYN